MTPAHWLAVSLVGGIAMVLTQHVRRRRTRDRHWAAFFRAPLAGPALAWIIFLMLVALAAPWIAPFRPSLQLDIIGLANRPPSWAHPFGTDALSRDLWSRLVYGARVSLGVGTLAMVVAIACGGVVGLLAGYRGGRVDAVLMRLVDVGLAIPRIFVILVGIALWGQFSAAMLIVVLGATGWFATSRLVRAEAMVLRHGPMVAAARALGAPAHRIVLHHMLPNVAGTLLVSATLGVGAAMLLEAALSFLGVGVQPPAASWGSMIADGRDYLVAAPWTTVFPGLAIAMAVLALNALGDALREMLDPRADPG